MCEHATVRAYLVVNLSNDLVVCCRARLRFRPEDAGGGECLTFSPVIFFFAGSVFLLWLLLREMSCQLGRRQNH